MCGPQCPFVYNEPRNLSEGISFRVEALTANTIVVEVLREGGAHHFQKATKECG